MTNPRDAEERPEGPENRPGATYQAAFEAVFAILIAAFLGNLADDHFGTAPRYLLVGFVIGFCSFVLRLVQLGRKLHDKPPKDGLDDQ